MDERNNITSLIVLKIDLRRLYTNSVELIEFTRKNYDDPSITSRDIIKYFYNEHNIKIRASYLKLLMEISLNYFNIKVPKTMKPNVNIASLLQKKS